jgi:hypothetical protein
MKKARGLACKSASRVSKSIRTARDALEVRRASRKPAPIVEEVTANTHPLILKLRSLRAVWKAQRPPGESLDLESFDIDEAGTSKRLHALGELLELPRQRCPLLQVQRLLAEDEAVDIGDLLAIIVCVQDDGLRGGVAEVCVALAGAKTKGRKAKERRQAAGRESHLGYSVTKGRSDRRRAQGSAAAETARGFRAHPLHGVGFARVAHLAPTADATLRFPGILARMNRSSPAEHIDVVMGLCSASMARKASTSAREGRENGPEKSDDRLRREEGASGTHVSTQEKRGVKP